MSEKIRADIQAILDRAELHTRQLTELNEMCMEATAELDRVYVRGRMQEIRDVNTADAKALDILSRFL